MTNRSYFPRSPWKTMIVILILSGIAWIGYVQWKIDSVIRYESRASFDVGIVLGAALWNDRPSPALRERLDHAARLYREGRIKHLIVSGGLDGNGSTITEAEGMKNDLTGRGIPEDAVFMETEASNTYENILFSYRIMKEQNWESAVIITHQYHGARALDIARFVGLKEPGVSTIPSQVLFMPYHRLRETLAYTKWVMDKMLISLQTVKENPEAQPSLTVDDDASVYVQDLARHV